MMVRSIDEGLSYVNLDLSIEKEKDGDIRISLEYERLEYRRSAFEIYAPNYSPVNWQKVKAWSNKMLEWVKSILNDQRNKLEEIRKKAQELLEDLFSPENVAKRILEFAYALSKGDVSKIPVLRKAVEKAFEEVKEMLGGKLPEITEKTRDLVMKRFDDWERRGTLQEFEELQYVKEELEMELVA